MPKYKVYLMVPVLSWANIQAKSKDDAITEVMKNDHFTSMIDWNEKHKFLVEEEDDEV